MREPGHLLRVLGVAFGLAAVVGSVVGQGILRTPGMVAGAVHTPEAMLGLWLLGGLIALIGGAVYVELGASVPTAGGPYDYARRAYGPGAAAITGWALLVAMVFAVANTAVVLGEYMVRLGVVPGTSPTLPSIAAMVLFCAINWPGTKLSAGVQIAFSAAKGAVLAALVLVLFAQPGVSAPVDPVEPVGAVTLAGAAMALRLIVGTYNGWQDVALYSEEIRDPGKALPRAMFGGLIGIIALYMLVNLALLHVMTPQAMAASNFPAADAAKLALGDRANTALTAFGVLSVAAITSLTTMSATRLAFSLARGGMLPIQLASVSRSGTPRAALLLVTIGTILCLIEGDYNSTSSSGTTLYQLCVVIALACAWTLRQREPELERPWRMPFYPWPIVLAMIGNLALLVAFVYDDPFNSLLGLGIVAGFALVALALRRWTRPQSAE